MRKDTEVDARIVKVARDNPDMSLHALQQRFAGQASVGRIRQALQAAGLEPAPHFEGLSRILSGKRRPKAQGTR